MSRILVLGGTGMLGHRLAITLSENNHEVAITTRNSEKPKVLPKIFGERIRVFNKVSAQNYNSVERVFCLFRPEIVINCVGVIKQKEDGTIPVTALDINSLFPQRLTRSATELNFRLILISTDCVFYGDKGPYVEYNKPDAEDLYGLSKLLGETKDKPNVLTIRTSIVGRELLGKKSLLEWFLSNEEVEGYTEAIFSGLPTLTLSKIISDKIIPKNSLCGLYHISSKPISKFDFLNIVNEFFNLKKTIIPSKKIKIDRSLDSKKFSEETGLKPVDWRVLVKDLIIEDPIYK